MTADPVLRPRTLVLIGLITMATLLVTAAPASAAPAITVSKSSGLNAAGDTITVTGSGFDRTKGIYVAVCVDNGPGQLPTPCLGGADTGASGGGSGGGSAWISDHPPSYGKGLTTPYGDGGTFSVTLSVIARDPVTGTDCTKVTCAVVTRADHTRTADRSQDARVQITFGTPPAPPKPAPTALSQPAPTTAPPPAATTTVPPTTTTTTPTITTTTSAEPAVDPAAAQTTANGGPGPGLWIGIGVVVLAAVAVPLLFRLRRRRNPSNDA